MARLDVPNLLIRFVRFDGAHLHFFRNDNPTLHESLPLDPAYHQLAAQLQPPRLCRATVLNGVIVALAPTRVLRI
ncbi:hypothetical protein [Sorangium cellulosum]|uniref:Uncharacterized protein n=1 Tax=Sorangium cellulosum So0157-2 TaxID=1254432 RepID=S4Y8T1_SORCE|nr:hypothetical protein [Sorangium cellulosum]AGP40766.1 hypothetical protein SCE1572_43535 [Sorangium cellulosum So0157-2]